ncbi:YgaP family membrane protein [Deinococcus sp. UYEF24]
MNFARSMARPEGRALRIVVGLALIFWGYTIHGPVLMVVGAIPLLAGIFDVCLIAPLLRAPFRGRDTRSR